MKVVFTRSYLIRTDSRLHRYFRALQERGVSYRALAWDRSGVEPDTDDCVYWHRPSPVGGGLRNLGRILAFNLFCLRELWRDRHNIFCVHAVDLDAALGATVFTLLTRKPLIFDAFDKYSDTRNLNGPLKWVCDVLERLCMRAADWVLLPDPCRVQQHGLQTWKNVSIIENVPSNQSFQARPKATTSSVETTLSAVASEQSAIGHPRGRGEGSAAGEPLKLAYVGTLEPIHRGLENLLRAVAERPGVAHLTLAGTGPLAQRCEEYAQRFAHIDFRGEVLPAEAMAIMADSEVVVGMYYLSSRNHRYAAPNKYYEHLLLGKALLTSAHTPPGARVEAHGTGWAITDTFEALQQWLESVQKVDVLHCGQTAVRYWQAHYADYFDQVLLQGYAERLAQWQAAAQAEERVI